MCPTATSTFQFAVTQTSVRTCRASTLPADGLWLDGLAAATDADVAAVDLCAWDADGPVPSAAGADAADEKGVPAVVEATEPALPRPSAPPVDAAEPAAAGGAAADEARRSNRQRARDGEGVQALPASLALHDRGIPIPQWLLARVPVEDRSALPASTAADSARPERQQRASAGQRWRQRRQA